MTLSLTEVVSLTLPRSCVGCVKFEQAGWVILLLFRGEVSSGNIGVHQTGTVMISGRQTEKSDINITHSGDEVSHFPTLLRNFSLDLSQTLLCPL